MTQQDRDSVIRDMTPTNQREEERRAIEREMERVLQSLPGHGFRYWCELTKLEAGQHLSTKGESNG
jgi:hypothetical protein